MGTWSVAIFGNDTAADVRDEFRELIEDGRSDEEATSEVLRKFGECLADPDDAPFIWTGLAAVQHRQMTSVVPAHQLGGNRERLLDADGVRRQRHVVSRRIIGDLGGPDFIAALGVDRHQRCVPRGEENSISV